MRTGVKTYLFPWFLLIIVVAGPTKHALSQADFELFAARTDHKVQLYWDCRSWPADLQGFIIKRCDAGTGLWQALHPLPVIPEVNPDDDFFNKGVTDAEEVVRLRLAMAEFIQKGYLTPVSADDMRQMLKQNQGPGSGDRIRMKSDFNLAMALGFAYTDETALPDIAYDYGLFARYLDGTDSSDPLDTFRLGLLEPSEPLIDFFIAGGDIRLSWELPAREVKERSILGFLIERRALEKVNFELIAKQPIGVTSISEGNALFRFIDNSGDPASDYIYQITPVNMFQQSGKSTFAAYVADRYKQLHTPQIKMVSLHEESEMAVYWAVHEEDSILIKDFVLELSKEPGRWEPPISADTIDGASRWFLDQRPKKYGDIYYYRLKARGKYGQESVSTPETFYYMGLVKPPELTGLQGTLIQEGQETFVHLKWNPKDPADSVTQGYAVYSDELIPDSLLQLSSLPILTTYEYSYKIETQGGRIYRFRIAGISKEGKAGIPGEIALEIGTLVMPRVYKMNSRQLDHEWVLVRWEYPAIRDLKGFRLLLNGKEIAGPSKIRPDMRSYLISLPETLPESGIKFTMIAVGSLTESQTGLTLRHYLPNKQHPTLAAPSYIQYEKLSEGVLLCWEPPSDSHDKTTGYALFTDYAIPGIIQRINTIPLIKGTEYIITSELPQREVVKVGIAAVDKEGRTGRIREIVIDMTHMHSNKDTNNNNQ